jgi:hypothetical protein
MLVAFDSSCGSWLKDFDGRAARLAVSSWVWTFASSMLRCRLKRRLSIDAQIQGMASEMPHRVATQYLASRQLRLGPGRPESKATAYLRRLKKIPAKNRGDEQSAVTCAAYNAQKHGTTWFAYIGNSFGHIVWRVASKPTDYLDPINNSGSIVRSVSPDLEVTTYEVVRPE